MPNIKTVSATILLSASEQKVFNTVTNWELQTKWIFATKVSGVGKNSHKIGGKLQAFTGYGKIGFMDTMTITKWEPPTLCEVTHTGNIVKGSGIFKVKANNGQKSFTWIENTELPFGFLGSVAWLIIGPLTKLGLSLSLRRFKRLI